MESKSKLARAVSARGTGGQVDAERRFERAVVCEAAR